MAATADMVRAITGSTLLDAQIQPFLDVASCVMEQVSECTAKLSTTCKDQVEAYLSAHFLTTSEVGTASKQIRREELDGKYSVEYLTPFNLGNGVLGTQFGQTANMLAGGCLSQLDKTPISFNILGSC